MVPKSKKGRPKSSHSTPTNRKGEEHQCLICETIFVKEERLKRHIVNVHEGSQCQVTVVPKSRKDIPNTANFAKFSNIS